MRKVAVFAGNNLTAHLAVNALVPQIQARSLMPVVYITKMPILAAMKHPDMQDFSFYESGILHKAIYPFLESRAVLSSRDGLLRPGMNYSPGQLGSFYGVEVREVANINDPGFIRTIAQDPDMVGGVSIRNLQIFRKGMIDVFRAKGFLWNLHVGELPGYRGVFIPPRVIVNGGERYGWTLHHIDCGIDTGNILDVYTEVLDKDKPMLRTYLDFVTPGIGMILGQLDMYCRGKISEGSSQSRAEGAYYSFPVAEELALWRRMGLRLVNPLEMANFYVSAFSQPGSVHAWNLKARVAEAIMGRESAGEILQSALLSVGNA